MGCIIPRNFHTDLQTITHKAYHKRVKLIGLIIPAFKPTPYILDMVKTFIAKKYMVFVIDDGNDPTFDSLFRSCEEQGAIRLKHSKNLGKGAALKTAFSTLLNTYPQIDYAVTCDADGQHPIETVLSFCQQIMKNKLDTVYFGVRTLSKKTPLKNRLGNAITRSLFQILYGVKIEDTQTGLRGIPRKEWQSLVTLPQQRFDYEMAMLIDFAKRNVSIESISIPSVYFDDGGVSSFRPFVDSVKIYQLMFHRLGGFIFVGLSSFALDWIIFLWLFLEGYFLNYVFLTVLTARLVSGLYNYLLNFYFVFRSSHRHRTSISRYLVIYFFNLIVSVVVLEAIHLLNPNATIIGKIIVDLSLFFVTYVISKRWIF